MDNSVPMTEPERPPSSLHVNFEDNAKMIDMFTGKGLGDKIVLKVEMKLTNVSEYSVGGNITKIGVGSMDDDDEEPESGLEEDDPISMTMNVT